MLALLLLLLLSSSFSLLLSLRSSSSSLSHTHTHALPFAKKKKKTHSLKQEVKVTEPSAEAQEPSASTSAPDAAAAAAAASADASASKPSPPPAPKPKPAVPEGKAEIYIGFEKGDYAPREGRVGRFLVDDPSKYPGRDNDFVGGWAGGEVGLKAFAAGAADQASTSSSSSSSPSAASIAAAKAKALKAGKVYIGHEKDDYEARRLGLPGRFVDDDPQRYPDKEDVGPLLNAVGGFAGGERGVKAFAATGEIPLAPDGKGKRQFSPLAFAGFVALVGAGGGLLLNGVEETVVEGGDSPEAMALKGVASELAQVAAVDGPQRAALTAGVAAVAALAGILAVKAAVDGARSRAAALGATIADGAKAAAFWVAVFFAFKLVIENS